MFHVLPNSPSLIDLSPFQLNWIILNMKEDSDLMQKEFDKIGKKKGSSVIRASTSDADFEQLIKSQLNQIKNSGK